MRSRTKPSLTSLVAFFVIFAPVVYLLSYAPVVRAVEGSDADPPVGGTEKYLLYEPVDWLIDNTPLRGPLWIWAGIWGVRSQFEFGHNARSTSH